MYYAFVFQLERPIVTSTVVLRSDSATFKQRATTAQLNEEDCVSHLMEVDV